MNNNITPKVSIIVPVFQVEKYIRNTIISILNQTMKDIEVILVDNNTKDKSIEIAEELLNKGGVKFLTVKQDKQGLAATRNKGFEVAKGEWVISIDSDDVISPVFIEELYIYGVKNDLVCVTTKYRYVNDEKKLFAFPEEIEQNKLHCLSSKEARDNYLLRKLPIMITNTIFKKSFLDNEKLRLDEEMIFGADLAFMWLVLIKLQKIGLVNKTLYNYYNRPDSLMTAPSMSKIESRISGFNRLRDKLSGFIDNKYIDWIVYREILGLIATLSQYGNYSYLKKGYNEYFTREMYNTLLSFPDNKIKMQVVILKMSPYFYNILNRYIRNNKVINKFLTKYRF